jgi:exopolysaccharide biosynthesis polyprenyl glycosylphosphotransferase
VEAGVSKVDLAADVGAPARVSEVRGVEDVPRPQRALAIEQPAHETARPSLEAWLGRACICWLCACVPLLAAGYGAVETIRLAVATSAAWLAAAAIAEESSHERRPAYGTTLWGLWLALFGLGASSALARWAPAFVPGRAVLLESAGVALLGFVLWEPLVRRATVGTRRLLVVGTTPAAAELLAEVGQLETPYRLVGVVDDGARHDAAEVVPAGSLDELPEILARLRPDVIVVAGDRDRALVFGAIAAAAGPDVTVVGIAEFHEHVFGRLPLRHLSPAWFAATLHLYRHPYSGLSKRVFDVVVAAVGLVVSAPLLLLIGLLVRQTKGPILYSQIREGQGGRLFRIHKFRTMVVDAEADGRAVWAGPQDPRITRVGRILRQTRLDELPQLWNVLAGTMSIVGPRPERPEHSEALAQTIPFWPRRMLLKPGITGWAQVNRGYAADCAAAEWKLSYDLWYLRHRSLLVDAAICLRTFARLTAGAR